MERNKVQPSQRVTASLDKKLKSMEKKIKQSGLIYETLLTYTATIEKPNKQTRQKTLSA